LIGGFHLKVEGCASLSENEDNDYVREEENN
jgi:hypothetical protein